MKALILTASIVLLALMACIGLLSILPGPEGGGPVVTLAVTPPPPPARPGERLTPGVPAPESSIDLPPGFGITAPGAQPQSAPGTPAAPQQQAASDPAAIQPPQSGAAVQEASPPSSPQPPAEPTSAQAEPELQQVAAARPIPLPQAPESETAPITLVSTPVPELVEESRYGPLPKVAPDGKRPLEVYARPSRYAALAAQGAPPRVAILINGMGHSDAAATEVIMALPAPISVAYGAYGRNLQEWVDKARSAGHEVLLQVPLEPLDYPQNDPGPHTLLTTLPADENMKRLQWLMSRFTGYVGVTNLMGSKFTATQDAFAPVLSEVKARGLLFVDDSSGQNSVTGQLASVLGLDYSIADVQIDASPAPDDIGKALSRLETVARERGTAIGVATAKPSTIKQVAAWAGKLQAKGFVLIPVSAAVRSQRQS